MTYTEIKQKVSRINFVNNYEIDGVSYMGYIIKLEDGKNIKILLEDTQNCCEFFGTDIFSPIYNVNKKIYKDKYKDYFDLKNCLIHSIKWGTKITNDMFNQALEKEKYYVQNEYNNYCVVNIYTDKGMFQIVLYNNHDGYYSHNVYVEWNDYKDIQDL